MIPSPFHFSLPLSVLPNRPFSLVGLFIRFISLFHFLNYPREKPKSGNLSVFPVLVVALFLVTHCELLIKFLGFFSFLFFSGFPITMSLKHLKSEFNVPNGYRNMNFLPPLTPISPAPSQLSLSKTFGVRGETRDGESKSCEMGFQILNSSSEKDKKVWIFPESVESSGEKKKTSDLNDVNVFDKRGLCLKLVEEEPEGKHRSSAGKHGHTKLCARGHWRPAEDAKLKELVAQYGPQNWNLIAENLEGRSGN